MKLFYNAYFLRRFLGVLVLIAGLALPSNAQQVPQRLMHQSVLRNNQGQLVANQNVSVRISILQGSAVGSAVYSELHQVQTNANGLMTLKVGDGQAVLGQFGQISWALGPYFLQTEVDIAGGSQYGLTQTTELMSVPFALLAQQSLTPGPAGPQGPVGPAGPAGNDGAVGPQGPAGPAGSDGAVGPQGPAGPAGSDGAVGPQGPAGPAGNDGAVGPQGPAGSDGSVGPQGPAGPAGNDGAVGPQGPAGPVGPAGNDGAVGPQGPVGPVGPAGNDGAVGPQGPAGSDGAIGPQGPVGPVGPAGNNGAVGPQGPAGPVGPAGNNGAVGPQGPAGPAGNDGAVGPQGPVGPSGPVGPAGPAGNDGAVGPQGPAGPQGSFPNGTQIGQMHYWNGNAWVYISPGVRGQNLTYCDGVPTWGACIPVVTTSTVTGISATVATTGGHVTADGGAAVTGRGVAYGTTAGPTTAGTITSDGTGMGIFSSQLSGLTGSTQYYVRAYATNAVGTAYGSEVTFATTFFGPQACPGNPIMTDVDGNNYNTVQIGTQCWTQSNLKVSKYRNGAAIPTGLTNSTWASTTAGAYAVYNNDPANDGLYGKLYNYHTVTDSRGLCPTGWHVPTDGDWTNLATTLGGSSVAGVALKSTASQPTPGGWLAPNTGANNSSGFTAMPGGYRITGGLFYALGYTGAWWSSSLSGSVAYRNLSNNSGAMPFGYTSPSEGYSVRCLWDSVIRIVPTVTTALVSEVTSNSFTAGGDVTSEGGAAVTARGVAYGTTASPTIAGTTTSSGTGTGAFSSQLSGLTGGTQYYVRAYATNAVGTAYGAQVTFTTAVNQPTVTTAAVTGISATGATTGGNVTSDGGGAVTARGVAYGTTASPTIAGTTTNNGTGTGAFSSQLSGLTATTQYYVRAYATNTAGTAYGAQVNFTTSANQPTVTTAAVTDISATGATTGGNVTSDGGAAVTARGVAYGTTASPTIAGTITSNGTGTGAFSSQLSGLTGGTQYDVRAYATNTVGTAYGAQVNFTTSASQPAVSTDAVTAISATGATTGGNVTSDGGAAVTARGVAYGTTTSPTIAGTITNSGSGTGSFGSTLSGLTSSTQYFVRAYATNAVGTAYGNEQTFTTSFICGTSTVSDVDGITYNTVLIGTQCWTRSNLRVSKYRNGDAIPTGLSNSAWQTTAVGAYAVYNNALVNDTLYGKLYNHNAVTDSRGLCPTGWHVPTNVEWTNQETTLGGRTVAGGALKSTETQPTPGGWNSPNTGATNSSGFTARPGGLRDTNGNFGDLGGSGFWWSTSLSGSNALARSLSYGFGSVAGNYQDRLNGFSVRCLRD